MNNRCPDIASEQKRVGGTSIRKKQHAPTVECYLLVVRAELPVKPLGSADNRADSARSRLVYIFLLPSDHRVAAQYKAQLSIEHSSKTAQRLKADGTARLLTFFVCKSLFVNFMRYDTLYLIGRCLIFC